MPQSRTRTSRAANRARYRKPKHRRSGSMGWTVAIIVIVLVFAAFVALQVNSNRESNAGGDPGAGHPYYANAEHGQDHWHTYLGVNICGEWLTSQPTFENPVGTPAGTQNAGIHTHGDGLIHTHPFVPSEAGKNATLGKFADYAGWSVSADSIDVWVGPASAPSQKSWSNGATCPFGPYKGQKAKLVWAVDGKTKSGNPSSYHQQNGETIAIGFLPTDAPLDFPPDACNAFATISDQNTPAAVSAASPCLPATTTTAPAETTTTAPAVP